MKINRFIFWTPRILSILFILFLAMFSLDAFESCSAFLDCSLALFMHNLPALILLIILIISWKYEIVGGIIFILAGLFFTITILMKVLNERVFEWYMLSYPLIIAGPAFLIGFLFLINWKKKNKMRHR